MTWLTIVRGLQQRWWLLILCPVAAVLAVYVAAMGTDDTYRSLTTMVIAPSTTEGDSFSSIDALRILEQRSIQGTFVDVASDDSAVDSAAAQIGIDAARRQDFEVRPTIPVGSNVIEVAIVGPEALEAQQLCQLLVNNAITRFAALYPMYTIQVLQPADLPTDPQQRTGSQELALATILGLGAAALIAALWMRADDLRPPDAGRDTPADDTSAPPGHEPGKDPGDSAADDSPAPAVDEPVERPVADAIEPAPIFKRRPTRVRRLTDEETPETSPEGAADSRATAD